MFDAATWRTQNRRHFAAVEDLYRQVDRPMPNDHSGPEDGPGYAAELVFKIGSLLLVASIQAGTAKRGDYSKRRASRAWKEVPATSGARASVFLTVGAAEMLSPEVENDPDVPEAAIRYAQDLVERIYKPPVEDLEAIQEVKARVVDELNSELTKMATEMGGTKATYAKMVGQVALSFHALKLAGLDPSAMPAFEDVAGVDPSRWREISGLNWMMTFSNEFGQPWLYRKAACIEMAESIYEMGRRFPV